MDDLSVASHPSKCEMHFPFGQHSSQTSRGFLGIPKPGVAGIYSRSEDMATHTVKDPPYRGRTDVCKKRLLRWTNTYCASLLTLGPGHTVNFLYCLIGLLLPWLVFVLSA